MADTVAVRGGEELPAAALAGFLRGRLAGLDGAITVEQFPAGHSNLTYLLRGNGAEYVLRRGPLGPVAPKAHDMAREYGVLAAVNPHFPEAPRVYLLCADPEVIGAVFFVMERRRGHVLRSSVAGELAALPDYGRVLSEEFIDCLARLHAIDIAASGLDRLGKPEGFLERQVRGWTERWQRAQTEPDTAMEEVAGWLTRHMPASGPPTLVHNDYKLDNLLWNAQGRIEAVLDWEMATVGDPLADLGLTLCYWTWANLPGVRAAGTPALTAEPGWLTRDQLIERYAERSGRDTGAIPYYEVLGIFKLAVIVEQIYFRYRRGQTRDERFADFGERAKKLARLAATLLETRR